MIDIRRYDDITLLITKIDAATQKDNRRQAEREAVARLATEAFGCNTDIAHYNSGAPYIEGNEKISVTVSHCRDFACLAFSNTATVGVDAECWRPQLRRVAARVLSEAELQAYSTDGLLLRAWTLKEALYKAALTPGLDFRRDIALPLPPGGKVAEVCRHRYETVACIESGDSVITLVKKSGVS